MDVFFCFQVYIENFFYSTQDLTDSLYSHQCFLSTIPVGYIAMDLLRPCDISVITIIHCYEANQVQNLPNFIEIDLLRQFFYYIDIKMASH